MKHDDFMVGMLVCLSAFYVESVWQFLSRFTRDTAEIKPGDVLLIVGIEQKKCLVMLHMRLNKIVRVWPRIKHFDIIQ